MDLEIDEVPITTRSPFAGKTIESSRIRQDSGVIILAIKRESRTCASIPRPTTASKPAIF